MALSSILETANHSAAIDTILHNNALAMVEAILKSAIRDPSTETSGVSFCIHSVSDQADIQGVRTAALRCLAIFPDVIRFEALQKEKSRVIRELGNALDDPVRAVRKEAVECRAKWSVHPRLIPSR
jgi:DNA repair/transcription protein MET18/MMS19